MPGSSPAPGSSVLASTATADHPGPGELVEAAAGSGLPPTRARQAVGAGVLGMLLVIVVLQISFFTWLECHVSQLYVYWLVCNVLLPFLLCRP